jgi:hypothetical protein
MTNNDNGQATTKHVEDNIQKYPRNFMRRMDYPVFDPARMDI